MNERFSLVEMRRIELLYVSAPMLTLSLKQWVFQKLSARLFSARGLILTEILTESKVNDRRCFLLVAVYEMSVCLESAHADRMATDILNHLLRHDVLHETYESMS